ncbi:VirB6/TrbL-like conjugal transfer protein, CD1112 family [Gordonibacter sp. RACS_AR49]|uniref:VirB6/TrbL-like conjugal transfer protein, CD1112 family n=1 Tax=Gordonibacter sp. RACS_AR49 TaxID=2871986 RepID=UPI00262C90D3|nr:CD0415/CD1112 family protein [Gordonibacter sp. RACS_AR49]MDN4508596.1 conjugal transfer protein TrbL [Gordonibacter sp. RACS_AR49]
MSTNFRKALAEEGFAIAFSTTVLLCALLFAAPAPAFADIASDINAWLCGILRDTCNWIFAGQTDMLRSIGADGVLSAGFEQMLGSAGTVTMYDLVRGAWRAAILPIGCGMLSFVFTVQLIKVSQKMDGNASMPGVKEVVFMLVFFAVFLFLIQNSFDLMQAVYEVVKLAIDRVAGLLGNGAAIDLAEVSITTTDDDVAALLAMLVVALASWLVVIVAYVVALVVSWARAIQIYVMAAFSPIPFALMSLDETRQMGVGYLKNFAAVCLAGVVILVLLVSFPIVLGGLDAASAGVPVVDSIVGGLSYALQYLAMCVLLILSLVKSGSWARDVMGG